MNFKRPKLHKNSWKTWSLYLLVGLFVLALAYNFLNSKQVFFSPSLQQLDERSSSLHMEFDIIQNEFNEKKADYVECITDLSGLIEDFNSVDGDISQQQSEITEKNKECQSIYEDISNNIGSSNTVNRCTLLSNKVNDLLSEIQDLFKEEDTLVENNDQNADPQTLEYIVDLRDQVGLLELTASEFCANLIYVPDPCSALEDPEYNGKS